MDDRCSGGICSTGEPAAAAVYLWFVAGQRGFLFRRQITKTDSPALIWVVCPASSAKILRFPPDPNHRLIHAVPSHLEGRLAIVTDAGRDAVDVDVPITNGTEADGEDVWS